MRLGLVSRLTTPGMSSVLAQPSRVERPLALRIANQSSARVLDRDVIGACSRAPGPARMVTSYLQGRSSANEKTMSGQRLG
jgi:hypothetical protein